jgi:hypothetical protein
VKRELVMQMTTGLLRDELAAAVMAVRYRGVRDSPTKHF